MALRDFQQQCSDAIDYAYQQPNVYNVMLVMPTGGGKTVTFCHKLVQYDRPSVVIAHRQELVAQACLALNREQVPFGIIAPKSVVQQIVRFVSEQHGRSFYNPRAAARVSSVDTLNARGAGKDRWYEQVEFVIQDEGHHVLAANKWGKAMALFPRARGLFCTAHAVRADGCGLGRASDGLVDHLVIGPSARDLIGRGFLTDYDVVCPEEDVDISDVDIGPNGEFVQAKLRNAVHRSKTLVGNIVDQYIQHAGGKLGVTFAVDIESAQEIARAYCARNVRAEVIHAETPIHVRSQLMQRFRARDILQLVSVDVLGEGVDVPAIEVVSMGRHTASWQVFAQQFGRSLRVMVSDQLAQMWGSMTDAQRLYYIAASAKPKATVIDHVGNLGRHYNHRGLPCSRQVYSLGRAERRDRKARSDAIPLTVCSNKMCRRPFEAFRDCCPKCGTAKPLPAARSTPEQVEGNMVKLDPMVLAALRGEIERVDGPCYVPQHLSGPAIGAIRRNHSERQEAQRALRETMAVWGGWQRHQGHTDSEMQVIFFYRFGVDVMTAQTLGERDAYVLQARLMDELNKFNVRVAA